MRFQQKIDFHTNTSDLARLAEQMFSFAPGAVNLATSAGLSEGLIVLQDVAVGSVPLPEDAQIISDFAATPGLIHPDLLAVLLRYFVAARSVLPFGSWVIRVE